MLLYYKCFGVFKIDAALLIESKEGEDGIFTVVFVRV